jgi:hypothetical protein
MTSDEIFTSCYAVFLLIIHKTVKQPHAKLHEECNKLSTSYCTLDPPSISGPFSSL